jgi:hypothetical protein
MIVLHSNDMSLSYDETYVATARTASISAIFVFVEDRVPFRDLAVSFIKVRTRPSTRMNPYC